MNIMTGTPVLDQEQDLAFTLSCSAVADDALRVHSFTALEAISAPYEVHLDLASMDPQIDLHGLIDTPASLNILHKYDAPRHLAGVIVAAEEGIFYYFQHGENGHHTLIFTDFYC